jgi:hypothetical protein
MKIKAREKWQVLKLNDNILDFDKFLQEVYQVQATKKRIKKKRAKGNNR